MFMIKPAQSSLPSFLPLWISALLTCANTLSAQSSPHLEQVSIEQGLSYTRVHSFLQDSRGFLWIGTEIGLNRYDGYHFTVYKHDFRDSCSLIQNSVIGMHEDGSGTLWLRTYEKGIEKFDRVKESFIHLLRNYVVQTVLVDSSGVIWCGTKGGGLCRYNHAGESFTQFTYDTLDANSLGCDTVLSICEPRKGNGAYLWVGTMSRLKKFDRVHGRFVWQANTSLNRVCCLYEDTEGILWIGTRKGVYRLEPGTEHLTGFVIDKQIPERNVITKLYEDTEGRLWCGTEDGLARLDRRMESFRFYRNGEEGPATTDRNQEVRAILQDRTGMLWVGSYGGGLGLYDPVRERFTYYGDGPKNVAGLNDDIVNTIYEDRAGTLWFGTVDAGAYKLDRSRKSFVQYLHDPRSGALNSTTVSALIEDRAGAVWLGTSEGLVRFDKSDGSFISLRNDPKDPNTLSTNYIWSLLQDHEGALWVGMWDGGLDRLDSDQMRPGGKFKHFRHIPGNPKSLHDNHVRYLLEDRSGTLWVCTDGALSRFNRSDDTFTHYPVGGYCMCEDSRGALWLGGEGLYRFDRSTETFTHFAHVPGDSTSLSDDGVSALHEDQDGVLWVGTFGGGLNRFDQAKGVFTTFTVKDGLPDDYIAGVLEDDHHHLWLSTAKGIVRFDARTNETRRFDASDGVSIIQGWGQSHFKNPNGEMYIGGMYGFVEFHPDSIRNNPYIPPVVLTAFRVFDRTISLDSAISEKKEIDLSYRDNMISFEFAALNYTSSEKNQYAYRLEGFDKNWIFSGARRYATYTNLDGRKYVFRVKGSNNDGLWNEVPTSIAVVIAPPWWETWWFRIPAIVTLFGVVGGSVRYVEVSRLRRRMRELEHQKALEGERVRIAGDLHDELATNLTSIAMLSKIVHDSHLSQKGNLQHVQVLDRITALSSQSVDAIRDIIWAMDPKSETLDALLIRLRDLLVPSCQARNIRLRFDHMPSEPMQAVNLEPKLRRNLWLLLKEATHNALRHSDCSEMEISARCANESLRLDIRDNGKGYDTMALTSGRGLRTMKMRAEQINGVIEHVSIPEQGTTVSLTIRLENRTI